MFNKRLTDAVSAAKKYIIGNVAINWIGLWANIGISFVSHRSSTVHIADLEYRIENKEMCYEKD